ncbi:Uncharacterised protein [Salmonella enterica subsp. enterica]|nr:Uncharacterised protein [Salmonella enterica subsp. enterica]
MFAGAHVAIQLQRDGLIDFRAFAVTNVAAQPLKVEAVFLIQQHRQPHARVINGGDIFIQRPAGADFGARNVFTHFAGDVASDEIGRACR